MKSNWFFLAMLAFVPVSIAAELLHWDPVVIFTTSVLAIVPLAKFMGQATEEIAVVSGPTIGGLLNATFGNATELIIALVALNAGLYSVVKASLTGSIIGNILLVVGLAVFLGGLKFKEQEFQPIVARLNASLMTLAVIAMLLPAAVHATTPQLVPGAIRNLSLATALILITVYILSLIFSLRTHSYLYELVEGEEEEHPRSKVNVPLAVATLLGATVLIAFESEFLVGAIEKTTSALGLTELFVGVIIVPLVGNAAEHATAVTVAMKNKMDLALTIAIGSSLQIAMFVAPVLVLAGWAMGRPMDLDFNLFEVVAVIVSVTIVNSVASDGRSNWLEGVQLLATYAIVAFAFLFHP
ncbi:calcium/proton exchanger [Gloeobacter kilaueensis]|uniref:Ca(2+)/H(+) antiporter n=1 Tax=Gloeobacter kilaueensis (strain ATCC BAA-2537 / CCAP 1431/1 / ULC 316 / JS1) TaxID=1183438 RepID=U5QK74_GLOK1|nr:calcium/proton exchanger [Gloeobacter kilaueensis]AGY58085.1 calcium/proton exchanger [Gloeobacter kilaueensis JS1]